MTPEQKKSLVHRLLDEVFVKGNTDAFRELGTADITLHLAGYDDAFRGPEALKRWATAYRSAFDMDLVIEETAVDGDTVMVRWTMHSLHKGEYNGVPPTGRRVTFTALEWFHLEDGKIKEVWNMFDSLNVVRQLGVLPKGMPPRPLLRFVIWLQRLRRPAPRAG